MTEAEWLSHGDHQRFIHALLGGGSERQLRLFACACCRRVARFTTDERTHNALDIAEAWADRKATGTVRKRAEDEARDAYQEASEAQDWSRFNATTCVCYSLRFGDGERMADAVGDVTCAAIYAVELGEGGKRDDEELAQAFIAADIMGNPFASPSRTGFDPTWRSRAVMALAKAMYAEGAFDRMFNLADALQEAGCDDAHVLEHCRGTLPHVRGCWVVDLILGKE